MVIADPHVYAAEGDNIDRLDRAVAWIAANVEEMDLRLVLIVGDMRRDGMRRPALQVGRVGPLATSSRSAESPAMISYTQCVVGVDLGDRVSLACVYAQGVIVEWMEFAMTPEGVRKAFAGKGYARVAMEAGRSRGG